MVRKLSYLLQQVSDKKLLIQVNNDVINVEDVVLLVDKEKCIVVINPNAENRDD